MKLSAFKLFALLLVLSGVALAQQPINLVDVGGTVLGAVSAYGTGPGAVNVIGVNAYITNIPAVTGSGVFEVGPTTSANTAINPFFYELSNGTNSATFMSTTTTSKYGLDTNILSILGTAPTTAGFLDVKGADGNVFVRQATAANLNATVVPGAGVFEVGPTGSANTASNTFFSNLSDGTHALSAAVSAWNTAPTGTFVMGVNADLFINGVASAAAASGVQQVGIVGHAGAAFDAAGQNVASPANEVLMGGQFNTSPTTITSGNMSPLQLNNAGQLLVACTGCSASATVSLVPEATGGISNKHFVAAASDNATNLKASAGQVYSVDIYNAAAYPVYLKLYNASSSPTGCGASNLFKVIGVQAGTEKTLASEEGYAMGTGIGYCATKGIADADDTALLLSDATFDIGWK